MTSGSTIFLWITSTKEKYELQDDLDKIYNVARMVIFEESRNR